MRGPVRKCGRGRPFNTIVRHHLKMGAQSEPISEREGFENSYRVFRQTVEALALPPAETCEAYGGYNVAGELVLDVRAGQYLCESPVSTLTSEQKAAIAQLIRAVDSVPAEAVSFTDRRSESVANLEHPSWAPVRTQAATLLAILASATMANNAYFSANDA